MLMQVLGKGITSLDMTMGLLGLGPHSGSHCKWTYIRHELGKVEQKRANNMQFLRNLQIEIEATRARENAMEQLSETSW